MSRLTLARIVSTLNSMDGGIYESSYVNITETVPRLPHLQDLPHLPHLPHTSHTCHTCHTCHLLTYPPSASSWNQTWGVKLKGDPTWGSNMGIPHRDQTWGSNIRVMKHGGSNMGDQTWGVKHGYQTWISNMGSHMDQHGGPHMGVKHGIKAGHPPCSWRAMSGSSSVPCKMA